MIGRKNVGWPQLNWLHCKIPETIRKEKDLSFTWLEWEQMGSNNFSRCPHPISGVVDRCFPLVCFFACALHSKLCFRSLVFFLFTKKGKIRKRLYLIKQSTFVLEILHVLIMV